MISKSAAAEQFSASPRSTQKCVFYWVVFSAIGVRAVEAYRGAALFTRTSSIEGPFVKAFSDGVMPFEGAAVKAVFEELKQQVSPHLIFTHNRKDAHQDHRLVAELNWNAFRDHLIVEYEIPKYAGDLGRPNLLVPFESEICESNVSYIMEAFHPSTAKSGS